MSMKIFAHSFSCTFLQILFGKDSLVFQAVFVGFTVSSLDFILIRFLNWFFILFLFTNPDGRFILLIIGMSMLLVMMIPRVLSFRAALFSVIHIIIIIFEKLSLLSASLFNQVVAGHKKFLFSRRSCLNEFLHRL